MPLFFLRSDCWLLVICVCHMKQRSRIQLPGYRDRLFPEPSVPPSLARPVCLARDSTVQLLPKKCVKNLLFVAILSLSLNKNVCGQVATFNQSYSK